MDYSKTAPGSEWKYVSYNWDPLKYGPQQRGNVSSALMRRVGPKRSLIMYTSGQGQVGYAGIYRFDGEIAVPAGKISPSKKGGMDVWIDQNGDGLGVLGLDGSYQGRQLGVGWGEGLVYYPDQLCIDEVGSAFLADRYNNRVQIFGMKK